MNYRKIYFEIINKALRKEYSGQRWKGDGNYYEKHHIIPRSLNGKDIKTNLVLLTAREHYLCHWLLVKCFSKNTIERIKMIKAWFMMSATGDTSRPIISMRDYEKYKVEFSNYISKCSIGNKNSQFGLKWFTDLKTGKSHKFKNKPNCFYAEGRNWFNNEGKTLWNIIDKKPLTWRSGRWVKSNFVIQEERRTRGKIRAQEYWNKFHSGSYLNLSDYCKKENIEIHALVQLLKKYILLYNKMISRKNNGAGFKPNVNLVNIYE